MKESLHIQYKTTRHISDTFIHVQKKKQIQSILREE